MNPLMQAMMGGGGPEESMPMDPMQGNLNPQGMPGMPADAGMLCPCCGQPMPMPDNRMDAPQMQMPPGQLGMNQENQNPMAAGGMGGQTLPPELLMALLGGGGAPQMGM